MPEYRVDDLAVWTRGEWCGRPRQALRGVSMDSRTLAPGQVFLAMRGPNHDGHDHVRAALSAGASAAVVESAFADSARDLAPLLVVEDARRALQDMARGHRQNLRTCLMALTGSVGKTTVKEMTADVLATMAPTARTRGNWNNDIGLPLSLLALEPEDVYGVFEVGMNHPGELAPLCKLIQPSWGIITTIGPVHIEFFSSVRGIAEEKAEVFRALPPGGVAVACRDSEWFGLLKAAAPERLISTSLEGPADYQGTVESSADGRFSVLERESGERARITVSLPGRHVIQNALLALAVGRACGVAWENIARALARYTPPPMRWSRVSVAGREVINDAYNANPISMRAAMKTFAEMPATGGRWLALGGMRELGSSEREEHVALGREAAKGPWAGLVAVGALGRWIAEGAGDFDGRPLFHCAGAAEAGEKLAGLLCPGDALLLKASRGERLEEVLTALQKQMEIKGAVQHGTQQKEAAHAGGDH